MCVQILRQGAAQFLAVRLGGHQRLRFLAQPSEKIFRQFVLSFVRPQPRRQLARVLELVRLEPRRPGPPLPLDAGPQRLENVVQRLEPRGRAVENLRQFGREEHLEKRRVQSAAPVVLRTDVVQISRVGQRVLGDDIAVPPVKILVLLRLAAVRNEALAKDHVGRAKPPRVRPAVHHRVARHFGINHVGVGSPSGPAPAAPDRKSVCRPARQRRREHVMPVPVAEPVPALLAVKPMRQRRNRPASPQTSPSVTSNGARVR